MSIRIKDWEKFQHYKNKVQGASLPWIKLYRALLDDPEWHDLDGEAAKTLMMLWLVASEHDGQLPDAKRLAFRMRIPEQKLSSMISKLSHWLYDDSRATLEPTYAEGAQEEDKSKRRLREEEDGANAPPSISSYAFESGVIRLKQKDFDNWKVAFSHLDLAAELVGLASWAADQGGRWFPAVSAALAKKNRELGLRIEQSKQPVGQKWRSGIEGVV